MSATAVRQPIVGLAILGAGLVFAAFASPALLPHDPPGEVVTRQTARVAVLFWGLAAATLLLGRRNRARAAWIVGAATFVVHVATAFDRYHHWSHSAAYEHVEIVSGFGPGLFVSYLFTILWVADAAWWWIDTAGYERRSAWLDRGLHAFFAFVVLNGTVVYETGFIRWAGVILFSILGVLFACRALVPVRARA